VGHMLSMPWHEALRRRLVPVHQRCNVRVRMWIPAGFSGPISGVPGLLDQFRAQVP